MKRENEGKYGIGSLIFGIIFLVFSYSNDGISDVKKIYKIATCKHDFFDVGCFLLDNNGNYYDMDYVVKYLDNHSNSDTEYENDLQRPGTGYRKRRTAVRKLENKKPWSKTKAFT